MSKIKFDEKDFGVSGSMWESILVWRKYQTGNDGDAANAVNETVKRLIKKYVKRERKRLARVMQPTTITKDELVEILKQEREKDMNWPADFPGKH